MKNCFSFPFDKFSNNTVEELQKTFYGTSQLLKSSIQQLDYRNGGLPSFYESMFFNWKNFSM